VRRIADWAGLHNGVSGGGRAAGAFEAGAEVAAGRLLRQLIAAAYCGKLVAFEAPSKLERRWPPAACRWWSTTPRRSLLPPFFGRRLPARWGGGGPSRRRPPVGLAVTV
jgi:hypothetical protein